MTEPAPPGGTAVSAVMHRGVIACPPQTPLSEVAALMAGNGVHSVVVEGLARRRGAEDELVWGIVSDTDLMRAAAAGDLDVEVDQVAATEMVTVDADASVERAMQLMGEHEISHLVVVAPLSGEPVGVVSTLDVAALIGAAGESAGVVAGAHDGREANHG